MLTKRQFDESVVVLVISQVVMSSAPYPQGLREIR